MHIRRLFFSLFIHLFTLSLSKGLLFLFLLLSLSIPTIQAQESLDFDEMASEMETINMDAEISKPLPPVTAAFKKVGLYLINVFPVLVTVYAKMQRAAHVSWQWMSRPFVKSVHATDGLLTDHIPLAG